MTILNFDARDLLGSLSWYMSARKTALRAALSFRTPLSVIDQVDIRVHHSGYFTNLLAAIDLLIENSTLNPNDFKLQLESRFVFDEFQDGKANHSYIRELRNAIVHRGLNITSAAHIQEDFPLFLSELVVKNRDKTKLHYAFDTYLLGIIKKCESVVCHVMFDYLNAANIFESTVDIETTTEECKRFIEQPTAIPDHIKALFSAIESKSEWFEAAHTSQIMDLREAVSPFDLPEA
ncbi:hypothetical protein [Chromobacterium subtsugae]|uniref:hypothetical protein n=1 Tax=Chromobacterium subtsugae TaxID=251747 RepID=UPI00096E45F0|nr:hypothetical protein [Chromobacterium subtsugae]